MGFVGDLFKGSIGTGLLIGVGAIVLGPVILPVLAGVAKPAAKALIKGGIIFYEKSRETFAELSEVAEDLYAEAQAEVAHTRADETTHIASAPTHAEAPQPGAAG